ARPLMGAAGAGSIAAVVNAAIGNRSRFNRMRGFFEGVGQGENAGVWREVPEEHAKFRKRYAAKVARDAKPIGETA
ncbi:MAG: chlorophyllide reductase subunit Y, partial [Pseudomonadota bacterium]